MNTKAARIFSGSYSSGMWDNINSAKTVADLRLALYTVCCRIQELEERVSPSVWTIRYDPTAGIWTARDSLTGTISQGRDEIEAVKALNSALKLIAKHCKKS